MLAIFILNNYSKNCMFSADNKTQLPIEHSITDTFVAQWLTDAFIKQPNIAKVSLDNLASNEDEELAILDIGAEKVFIAKGKVQGGTVVQNGSNTILYLRDENVLEHIVKAIADLNTETTLQRIGISSHGLIENHKYIDHAAPQIAKELEAAGFTNDLGGYLQKRLGISYLPTMYNDAVSGSAFAYGAVTQKLPDSNHLIYLIVGGGVGGAYVSKDGTISGAEPGHVTWVPYPDDPKPNPCPQAGPKYCGEVYAKGPYIEKELSKKYLGKEIPGPKLDELLEAGDEKAEMVYNHAARNVANILIGIMNGFDLLVKEKLQSTVIVSHGGVPDNVAQYNAIAQSFMMDYLQTKFGSDLNAIPIVPTKQLLEGKGDNAGALGAGLLAF